MKHVKCIDCWLCQVVISEIGVFCNLVDKVVEITKINDGCCNGVGDDDIAAAKAENDCQRMLVNPFRICSECYLSSKNAVCRLNGRIVKNPNAPCMRGIIHIDFALAKAECDTQRRPKPSPAPPLSVQQQIKVLKRNILEIRLEREKLAAEKERCLSFGFGKVDDLRGEYDHVCFKKWKEKMKAMKFVFISGKPTHSATGMVTN